MSETPYTQRRHYQFRGPTDSDDYNSRIQENYQDLVALYNNVRVLGDEFDEAYGRLLREHLAIVRQLEEMKERQDIIDFSAPRLTFHDPSTVENDRFDGTPYELVTTNRLSHDLTHGAITLPEVVSSSLSKLAFINDDNSVHIPSTLEVRVEGVPGSADSTGATIDSTEPEAAIARLTGRIWERNVIVNTPAPSAEMLLFVKASTDLFTTDSSNAVILHPYPVFGIDILEVAYTTNPDVMMDDGDGYTPLSDNGAHVGNTDAVGWVAPGGWPGDIALDASPKIYHFDPKKITGLRIRLRQRHYFTEGGFYIYSYGLSALDLRMNKYLDSGKMMIRFDAPEGGTISQIDNVIPYIWNVPEALHPLVFSHRVIWETSFNSGVYTDQPVPFSKRVWLEVSLNKMPGGGTPSLTGLTLQYPGS